MKTIVEVLDDSDALEPYSVRIEIESYQDWSTDEPPTFRIALSLIGKTAVVHVTRHEARIIAQALLEASQEAP